MQSADEYEYSPCPWHPLNPVQFKNKPLNVAQSLKRFKVHCFIKNSHFIVTIGKLPLSTIAYRIFQITSSLSISCHNFNNEYIEKFRIQETPSLSTCEDSRTNIKYSQTEMDRNGLKGTETDKTIRNAQNQIKTDRTKEKEEEEKLTAMDRNTLKRTETDRNIIKRTETDWGGRKKTSKTNCSTFLRG